jgi:hopene-associated glycosyltransferase HpnB
MTELALLSAAIWAYLLGAHGRFWQAGPELLPAIPNSTPPVTVIVPARDEAAHIKAALTSLLAQDYAGDLRVILVDDESSDGTGDIARELHDPRLLVMTGSKRPAGWSGKLWAVAQGIAASDRGTYLLLTDADIVHDRRHVASMVERALRTDLDLVSEMVELSRDGWAAQALLPAFVYFFQMLYPFAWVNDPFRGTAAAAGGAILIHRRALARIGGIAAIRDALIDDVALAGKVKIGGKIWLGHSVLARSTRPYPGPEDIWRIITRTAFTQLRNSWWLLIVTVLSMAVVWLAPPLLVLCGDWPARILGLLAWLAAMASYVPTLRRWELSPAWALALPLIALFYTAATIASAINHWRGRGVVWKNRAYRGVGA